MFGGLVEEKKHFLSFTQVTQIKAENEEKK
jgi:hypothetical protein